MAGPQSQPFDFSDVLSTELAQIDARRAYAGRIAEYNQKLTNYIRCLQGIRDNERAIRDQGDRCIEARKPVEHAEAAARLHQTVRTFTARFLGLFRGQASAEPPEDLQRKVLDAHEAAEEERKYQELFQEVRAAEQAYRQLLNELKTEPISPDAVTKRTEQESNLLERTVQRQALEKDLVGLAFSGGGIRSATFNLGILQGLAELGLLKRFDYLSTVSGGSWIGGWLTAWIKREGDLLNVERQLRLGRYQQALANRRLLSGIDDLADQPKPVYLKSDDTRPEGPEPIHHLRAHTSYLSPRMGFLSPDMWGLFGIYLRNLVLNQLVLLPAILVILLLSRLLFRASDPQEAGAWNVGILAVLGLGMFSMLAVWGVARSLWLIREIRHGKVKEGLSKSRRENHVRNRNIRLGFSVVAVALASFVWWAGWKWNIELLKSLSPLLVMLSFPLVIQLSLRSAWETTEIAQGRGAVTPFYQYSPRSLHFIIVLPLLLAACFFSWLVCTEGADLVLWRSLAPPAYTQGLHQLCVNLTASTGIPVPVWLYAFLSGGINLLVYALFIGGNLWKWYLDPGGSPASRFAGTCSGSIGPSQAG